MSQPSIILASSSPRRRELLAAAGIEFRIVPSSAQEIHDSTIDPGELCEANARLKAASVAAAHPGCFVIGADTLVFLDRQPFGKPKDLQQAFTMLQTLAGRTHEVRTGVCVLCPNGHAMTFHEITRVTFRPLDSQAIRAYHTLVDPLDKAGAYAIQEHSNHIIASIDGPFDNVMGLPVAATIHALRNS